ncbi:MAG: hypothetical protein ACPGPB_03760 [Flavobacteriaceae bacterium]
MKIKLILISLLLTFYSCKAQQVPENQYSNYVIGSWILEEDTSNKLVFTSNGLCKLYEAGVHQTTYEYTFSNNCYQSQNAIGVVYLKWKEINKSETYCLEVSGMTSNTLSLMIVDSAQILYYNRE